MGPRRLLRRVDVSSRSESTRPDLAFDLTALPLRTTTAPKVPGSDHERSGSVGQPSSWYKPVQSNRSRTCDVLQDYLESDWPQAQLMQQNSAAERTPHDVEWTEKEPPGMQIVRQPITVSTLEQMAERMFGDLVNGVVDVERGIMSIDGEMHSDEEALLLGDGSHQNSLWGVNLHPRQFGTPDFIEFDSVINIRPSQGNRTRSVNDSAARARVRSIVDRLVTE
jgi:hypothetical protein